jgi:hypothetical protein
VDNLEKAKIRLAELQMDRLNEADDSERVADNNLAKAKSRLSEIKQARQEQAEYEEQFQEAGAGEQARRYGSQAASAFNRTVLAGADMLTAPARVTGEFITGEDVRSPSEVVRELGVGEDFVPEGAGREAANVVGGLGAAAVGMTGVRRAGDTVVDVFLDIAGAGSSTGTRAATQARKTTEAIAKSDSQRLGNPEGWTDQQILQEAQNAGLRGQVSRNRESFDIYEEEISKAVEYTDLKTGNVERNLTDVNLPQVKAGNIGDAIEHLRRIGIDPDKALKVIRKAGGLKFADDMEDLIQVDKQFTSASGRNTQQFNDRSFRRWYDRNLLPVADAIRKYSDRRVGGIFERAIESNVRYNDVLAQRHMKPLERLVRLVNDDKQLKGDMLDLFRRPDKMKRIQATIKKRLGEKDLEAFNRFMKDATAQNQRAMKSLFKKEDGTFNDVYYLHTNKRAKNKNGIFAKSRLDSRGGPDQAKAALQDRTRAPAKKLIKSGEIDEYVNPLLSHIKYMAEQDQLIRLAEGYNMRPSLGMKGSAEDFFLELNNKLVRDGFDEDKAGTASGLMLEAFSGAKKAPPPVIRALMSSGYAGTLAQLKSAVLNSHDLFVAAFTQGGDNTLKGMVKTLRGEFGKTLDQMGMSSQGVGEFVRNFDDTLDDPTVWDDLSRRTQQLTDGFMLVSGFRMMDKFGKGKVLLASVEKMRQSARNKTLYSDFSDIATREELQTIQRHLLSGDKVADIPQEAAAIIEDLAFVALGKQQLISYAGRPVGYLNNAWARPLYAMTGFAIKQQALLRDMIGEALKQGDYGQAGAIAAKYVMYAGLGYGLIDETRSVAFKNEEWNEEDVLMGVVDQAFAAAAFNRFGSEYERQMASGDMYSYVLESLVPPGGLVQAVFKDLNEIKKMLEGDEDAEPTNTLNKIPHFGDYNRYYREKEDRKDG